ncbi:hypothetical protein [Bordetella parapertussis]|uniref:hypothetical protein n=1 Tax=Bordetella parapertussis TaxID=519 RepID=UPI0002EC817F|nr:hypothetical protein [Bordetella parapertussis]
MKPNILQWALGAAFACVAAASTAQDYPARPVHLIVPYPPGGGTDVVARAVAQRLQAELGQPVVVESKPGAARSSAPAAWRGPRRTATP